MLEEFRRHLDQEVKQQQLGVVFIPEAIAEGLADTGGMLVRGEKVSGGKTVNQTYVELFLNYCWVNKEV